MPFKYVRKSTRASWSAEDMSRAVNACKRREMSNRQASQAYNVPTATLRTKFKLNKGADTAVADKLGRKLVLGECFSCLNLMAMSFWLYKTEGYRRIWVMWKQKGLVC